MHGDDTFRPSVHLFDGFHVSLHYFFDLDRLEHLLLYRHNLLLNAGGGYLFDYLDASIDRRLTVNLNGNFFFYRDNLFRGGGKKG